MTADISRSVQKPPLCCEKTRCYMGKSRDLSEFERGMVVGSRIGGYSVSQTANLLGFSRTAVSRVFREWCEKRKTSSDRGSGGRKRLVDENGERILERMVEANSQATSAEIQALYNNSGVEKPISLRTTRRTLKRLGYSRTTQPQELLVAAGLEAISECTAGLEQPDASKDSETKIEPSTADTACCSGGNTET